jgi:hypothetical protein
MTESIATGLDGLDLDAENNANTPTPKDELDATIQALVGRGKHLHDEVETYVAAVIEKQNVRKVYEPVE